MSGGNRKDEITLESSNKKTLSVSQASSDSDLLASASSTIPPLPPTSVSDVAADISCLSLEELYKEFDACTTGLNLDQTIKTQVLAFIEKQLQTRDSIISKYDNQVQSLSKEISESERKSKDIDTQRLKLESDLMSLSDKFLKAQANFDSIPRVPNQTSSEMLIERDKSHMKSLQHRLEQLVAVHRQLLRKYASLELESNEMRKKIDIRDSRIKQLEVSNKGVNVALRQQAERHAAELNNLRDQVNILYNESRRNSLLEKSTSTSPTNKSPSLQTGPRSVRGGGGGLHLQA
jgi:chromosome segregation ATPase